MIFHLPLESKRKIFLGREHEKKDGGLRLPDRDQL